jgi:REP element-mobilizing transposase RayT
MPVRTTIPYNYGTFFITFTCYNWISLIDITSSYDLIYNWFDILKKNGHYINGYVIMPNHVHVMITFIESEQSINTIIGNGKRFIAYEIIKRLEKKDEAELLNQLSENVRQSRKANNKKHEVWELSFDWKLCTDNAFADQKLNYIHANPCKGKWNLSVEPAFYVHSSARFYIEGVQGIYPVNSFSEMQDVKLVTKTKY